MPSDLRPCVFLDRDGVLNRRRLTLVRRPSQVVLLPGIAEAAARLDKAGYALVIATNQEFVGHGYIRRRDHDEIMARCVAGLETQGAKVAGVYACVHPRTVDCDDRKPKPGMLLQAAQDLGLDLARSFMVGDQRKDMKAGRAAGCRTVLVDPRLRTRMQGAQNFADHVCRDLPAAADWILSLS
jgi:D-glycero-D-manno-heptose 1,7-bisphosphate phosphatase